MDTDTHRLIQGGVWPAIGVYQCPSVVKWIGWAGFGFAVSALATPAAEPREVIVDFEQAEIARPVPQWTEQGVVFSLAGAPVNSRAAGRVMFFPYLPTERKGILNAMALEQAIPLQARLPQPVSSVTLVLWGSTGCPARLRAFDRDDRLVAETAVPAVPGRGDPAEPVPQFKMTVAGPGIVAIRLDGPRNGEFLAVDELRFVPAAGP